MDLFLEVFKYSLPAIIVFLTTFFLVRWFLKSDANRRKQEFLLNQHKETLPIKMTAYERLTLFLERISAESIIIREQPKARTSKELQANLLAAIRTEYEHNIAMQVYLPPITWSLVKKAKEEMVRLVNISASLVKSEDPSIALGKTILEQFPNDTAYHLKKALDTLKSDIQDFYS
jgi:hypothetical protein